MFELIRHEWAAARLLTKIFIVFVGILSATGLGLVYYASSRWLADPLEGDRDTTLLESNIAQTGSSADNKARAARLRMQQHEILRRHFDAMGGAMVISSTVSLKFIGTVIFEDGTRQQVMVTKKNGDSVRISVSSPLIQTTICVSPDDAWRSLERMNEVVQVEDLDEEETIGHRRYRNVISELFLASVNGWKMEYQGIEEFEEDLVFRFDVFATRDHRISFFIDPDTFLDVGRLDRILNEDGTADETLRLHSDHMQADGMVIPGKVQTYKDGNLVQTFLIDQATRNGGVLDTAFARPVVIQ